MSNIVMLYFLQKEVTFSNIGSNPFCLKAFNACFVPFIKLAASNKSLPFC
ncbi:hypothetical protein HanRHA438_Chr03g0115301 [Helianthus annuus]|nr:hypothetical protein HanRHA438_Chr03g0115301 [Helianthus annuus]